MPHNDPNIEFTITRATLEDISSMASLEACWIYKNLPPNALSETGALFVPLGQEGIAKILSDKSSCILLGKESRKLCGMVIACGKELALEMWPHLSTHYAPQDTFWKESFVYVITVAVDPISTGKHIGSTLVKKLREWAKAVDQRAILAVIAIDPPNRRSLAMFKNTLGSEEVGRYFDHERKITWGLFKASLVK